MPLVRYSDTVLISITVNLLMCYISLRIMESEKLGTMGLMDVVWIFINRQLLV